MEDIKVTIEWDHGHGKKTTIIGQAMELTRTIGRDVIPVVDLYGRATTLARGRTSEIIELKCMVLAEEGEQVNRPVKVKDALLVPGRFDKLDE